MSSCPSSPPCRYTIPDDEILNGEYRVAGHSESKSQCDVYNVEWLHKGCANDNGRVQARAYDFHELSKTHAKHKRRAMGRLATRSILHTKWKDLVVIVYSTGSLTRRPQIVQETFDTPIDSTLSSLGHSTSSVTQSEDDKNNSDCTLSTLNDDGLVSNDALGAQNNHEDTALVENNISRGRRSTSQQESRRLRQRDRRRAKRQRTRGDYPIDETMGFGKNTLQMFEFLYLAERFGEDAREMLPEDEKSMLDDYLAMKQTKATNNSMRHREEFLKIIETEIVFLRRQYNKLPSALENCRSILECLFVQALENEEGGDRWNTVSHKLFAMEKQLKILSACQLVLPEVMDLVEQTKGSLQRAAFHEMVEEQTNQHRNISERLYVVGRLRGETQLLSQAKKDGAQDDVEKLSRSIEKLQRLSLRKIELEKSARKDGDLMAQVVPISDPFVRLSERRGQTQHELKALNVEFRKMGVWSNGRWTDGLWKDPGWGRKGLKVQWDDKGGDRDVPEIDS